MKSEDLAYDAEFLDEIHSFNEIDDFYKTKEMHYFFFIKRIIDVSISFLVLFIFLPLIFGLAFAVRRDGGPAIYFQERIGQHGQRFMLWKLRTMVPDAERELAAYLAADPKAGDEWRANQKLRQDPRVTPIGRLLRKYSLDELPQLFNVLRGDMSLIGPRPMMVDQESLYPGLVYAGLRPGLTGLWQVSERNDATFAARAKYDAAYAANLSWRADLKIAVVTIAYLAGGRGC